MLSKQEVLTSAIDLVSEKLNGIQKEFDALREALLSETKSTAGDKHETGRAMAQLEQEKLSAQLAETRKSLDRLKQINAESKMDQIGFGSLVKTSRGYFLVSVGIGAIPVGDNSVFCITAGSPIGQKLLGKSSGDSIELNGEIEIVSVI